MALYGLGLIVSFRGEQERARDLLTRSIECSRRCGWPQGEVHALIHLGPVRALCGDAAGAAEACHRAVALARRVGDPWLEAGSLFRSAFTLGLTGDVAQAKRLATASVALSPRTGDRRLRAFTQMTVAECLIQEGNAAEATAVLREALAVFEALPERWALLRAASLLAQACGARGDWARAAVLLGFVDTLSERTSGRPYAHMQAALDALDARVREQSGPAMDPPARPDGCSAVATRSAPRCGQPRTARGPSWRRRRPGPCSPGSPSAPNQAGRRDRQTDRLGPDKPADRRTTVHRRADRRHPRQADPGQARLRQRAQVAALVTAAAAGVTVPPNERGAVGGARSTGAPASGR